MTSNVMFYGKIVALNRDVHRDFVVDTGAERFGFARSAHVVPAIVQEFGAAAAHLPIVFLPGGTAPVAVFLVGLRAGHNACIDAEGRWIGDYVPAFLRRYPLIYGEVAGADAVVCIDETCRAAEGGGERLFTETGEDTPMLVERIRLMNEYFVGAKTNDRFVAMLTELGLLQAVTIDARFESGESQALHGFMTVDEKRLAELSDEDVLRLHRAGFLGPIHAHLCSLGSLDRVRRLS